MLSPNVYPTVVGGGLVGLKVIIAESLKLYWITVEHANLSVITSRGTIYWANQTEETFVLRLFENKL